MLSSHDGALEKTFFKKNNTENKLWEMTCRYNCHTGYGGTRFCRYRYFFSRTRGGSARYDTLVNSTASSCPLACSCSLTAQKKYQ